MGYVTLVFPFNAGGEEARWLLSTAWLFKIASHRMLGFAKQSPVLPATDIGWKSVFRKTIYEIIPNRRYADGVIVLIRGIYESCRQRGIDFRSVELSDWLMFQQSEKEYPVRNITLKEGYEFHITTLDYDGRIDRIAVKPTIPEKYKLLLNKSLDERQEYTARVVIKDYGVRKDELWVSGEIQLTIPIDFYYRHMIRYRRNHGELYAGVDVNTDRINLAIVDRDGKLRDTYTFWFREATARGFPRRRARIIIGMSVHKMLNYAYHHGVKTLFLENPEVLGRLRLIWIRSGDRKHENYNYRVTVFRSSVIEMIAMKAPLYGIEVGYENPKGTTNSKEHDEIMKKHRLDRHTASAYLIALKAISGYQ
ncbi:MAG: hypothetical protein QXP97_07535 [Desulfurococcus sp.]|uniref:hypothetical protein n=1 Tax=Desulfurococcus sp. TaxID=51678 RepID=UPI003164E69A